MLKGIGENMLIMNEKVIYLIRERETVRKSNFRTFNRMPGIRMFIECI